jgi:uncharacterized membrane protein YhaH (DUF805 family)
MNQSSNAAKPNKPFISYFTRWNDRKGTSTRAEFWAGFLWNNVLGGAATLVLLAAPESEVNVIIFVLILIGIFQLSVSLYLRRMRDLGWRPALLALFAVPFVNLVAWWILATKPSKA